MKVDISLEIIKSLQYRILEVNVLTYFKNKHDISTILNYDANITVTVDTCQVINISCQKEKHSENISMCAVNSTFIQK